MKKGFSLTELLIVLAIISMVAGTMNVQVKNKRIQANAKAIVECVKTYEAAISMYYLQSGKFPTNGRDYRLEDLLALKPYCPIGFNTLKIIQANNLTNLTVSSNGEVISISGRGEEAGKILSEVEKQLKEFALDDQFSCTASSGGMLLNPDGTTSQGQTNYQLRFYLKKNDNIYL